MRRGRPRDHPLRLSYVTTPRGRISPLLQTPVERGELGRLPTGGHVQRICKVHSGLQEIQRLCYSRPVLNADARQPHNAFQRSEKWSPHPNRAPGLNIVIADKLKAQVEREGNACGAFLRAWA